MKFFRTFDGLFQNPASPEEHRLLHEESEPTPAKVEKTPDQLKAENEALRKTVESKQQALDAANQRMRSLPTQSSAWPQPVPGGIPAISNGPFIQDPRCKNAWDNANSPENMQKWMGDKCKTAGANCADACDYTPCQKSFNKTPMPGDRRTVYNRQTKGMDWQEYNGYKWEYAGEQKSAETIRSQFAEARQKAAEERAAEVAKDNALTDALRSARANMGDTRSGGVAPRYYGNQRENVYQARASAAGKTPDWEVARRNFGVLNDPFNQAKIDLENKKSRQMGNDRLSNNLKRDAALDIGLVYADLWKGGGDVMVNPDRTDRFVREGNSISALGGDIRVEAHVADGPDGRPKRVYVLYDKRSNKSYQIDSAEEAAQKLRSLALGLPESQAVAAAAVQAAPNDQPRSILQQPQSRKPSEVMGLDFKTLFEKKQKDTEKQIAQYEKKTGKVLSAKDRELVKTKSENLIFKLKNIIDNKQGPEELLQLVRTEYGPALTPQELESFTRVTMAEFRFQEEFLKYLDEEANSLTGERFYVDVLRQREVIKKNVMNSLAKDIAVTEGLDQKMIAYWLKESVASGKPSFQPRTPPKAKSAYDVPPPRPRVEPKTPEPAKTPNVSQNPSVGPEKKSDTFDAASFSRLAGEVFPYVGLNIRINSSVGHAAELDIRSTDPILFGGVAKILIDKTDNGYVIVDDKAQPIRGSENLMGKAITDRAVLRAVLERTFGKFMSSYEKERLYADFADLNVQATVNTLIKGAKVLRDAQVDGSLIVTIQKDAKEVRIRTKKQGNDFIIQSDKNPDINGKSIKDPTVLGPLLEKYLGKLNAPAEAPQPKTAPEPTPATPKASAAPAEVAKAPELDLKAPPELPSTPVEVKPESKGTEIADKQKYSFGDALVLQRTDDKLSFVLNAGWNTQGTMFDTAKAGDAGKPVSIDKMGAADIQKASVVDLGNGGYELLSGNMSLKIKVEKDRVLLQPTSGNLVFEFKKLAAEKAPAEPMNAEIEKAIDEIGKIYKDIDKNIDKVASAEDLSKVTKIIEGVDKTKLDSATVQIFIDVLNKFEAKSSPSAKKELDALRLAMQRIVGTLK